MLPVKCILVDKIKLLFFFFFCINFVFFFEKVKFVAANILSQIILVEGNMCKGLRPTVFKLEARRSP